MKFLGNIIWLVFGGLEIALEYLIASIAMMVTIIGIPFGLQEEEGDDGLPQRRHECLVVLRGRSMDMAQSYLLRCDLLHHDYRYSIRKAAL